jgi:AAA domain
MTAMLKLNRLGVFRHGKVMYSESFHDGVNIIHGANGSGKSTIADFIFFSLGGELKEWKPQAELAEYTLAEVTAGTTILTLRRDVSSQSARPMQIFFGPFENALEAGPTEWRQFPYKRQDDNYSFSQVLFKAVGIPESISDGSSNITMHQILRLIYGDQLTPIQRIFRTEIFDTWQTRQAVGELMCGIGGYELYDRQIELRTVQSQFDEISVQLRNLFKVASSYGDQILPEYIEVTIANMQGDRSKLVGQLSSVMTADQPADLADDEAERTRKALARDLGRARRSVAELEDRITTLEYEIEDSGHFIKHLEATLAEFDDATTTFFALGQVQFEYCPACFAPAGEAVDTSHCHLCGSEVAARTPESAAIAVRLDIDMQLRESRTLQDERHATLAGLKVRLRAANTTLRRALDSSEIARRGFGSERENVVAELGRKIGFLDSELQVLQRRLELAAEVTRLSEQKEKLSQRITNLKSMIEAIISAQQWRKQAAYTAVSENVKLILKQDLEDHSDFGEIDHISFSFAEDWMAINDDKNRSRSASGMVVLKNSFLFGLYLSALADPKFSLPRFLLLDNIEDKGMVEERSWNFQRIIVAECAKRRVPQQVIFTTSKIAPELNKSEYVVGRKYTKESRSLGNVD